jgi:NADH-quinone oxidoreductase subunit A
MQAGWPFLLFIGLVILLVAIIMLLSYLLGARRRDRADARPYESGEPATLLPARGISIEFFRIAVFFVVFDLETAFLIVWALVAREAGWAGYFEILVFTGVLLAALAYLWRLGSLDWRDVHKRNRQG